MNSDQTSSATDPKNDNSNTSQVQPKLITTFPESTKNKDSEISINKEQSISKNRSNLKSNLQNATTPSGTKIEIEEISPGIFKATTNKSRYIIEYDMNKCIGAASCSAIAPLTFFMNEENKAELVKEGEWDDDPIIMDAAMSCPVFAIKIIKKETGEILFPEDEVY